MHEGVFISYMILHSVYSLQTEGVRVKIKVIGCFFSALFLYIQFFIQIMFWLPFRYLTKAPHPGGSAFSKEQAEHIKTKWEEFGLDKVELKKYDVLLSYPEIPGIASIKSEDGSTSFTAQRKEKVLEPSENDPNVLPPFNAYSSSGNVTVSMEIVHRS